MRYGWVLIACLAVGCKDKGEPGDAPASAAPKSAAAASAAPATAAEAPPATAASTAGGPSTRVAPAIGSGVGSGDVPAATAALSGAHTVAFFGLERPHVLIDQIDKVLGTLPAVVTAEIPAAVRDPALRIQAFGFDPATEAGWRGVGVDPTGGIGIAFDARMKLPYLYVKITDRAAALAALAKAGAKVTLGDAADGLTPLTIDGRTGFLGERNGYTLILPPDDAKKMRAAFVEVVKPDAPLSDDSTLKRAFSDEVRGLWISGYASGAALARLVAKEDAADGKVAQFYAERFEALSMAMGDSGGALRLLASAKGVMALRQLFSPLGAVPAFAKHIATDRVIFRVDVNFAEFFDGLLALIPEEMAQPRSMVLMGKNAIPMAIGVTFDQLAQAFTGHFAITALATSQGGPPIPTFMGGVKDGAQVDAVLKTITDLFKQRGQMPIAPAKVGGRDGYIVDGPLKFGLVRTETLLFAGPLADVEAAMALKTGLPPAISRAVDGLNVVGFFVSFDRLVNDMAEGPAGGEVAQMIPAAKAAWGEHLTDGYLMSRWIVDGRGVQLGQGPTALAIPGILAAVAIPAFVKYVRRSKTSEASMNVRKLFDGSVAYFHEERADATGTIIPAHFPASAPLTPATTACKDGATALHTPTPEMFNHPTWQALNFAIDDPFAYQYEYVSDGKSFTARALGDLDCDGVLSTFERVGTIDDEGNVNGGAGLFIKNDLE